MPQIVDKLEQPGVASEAAEAIRMLSIDAPDAFLDSIAKRTEHDAPHVRAAAVEALGGAEEHEARAQHEAAAHGGAAAHTRRRATAPTWTRFSLGISRRPVRSSTPEQGHCHQIP